MYVFSVFFRTVNHGKIKVSVRLTVLVNVFVSEKQAPQDFRFFKSSQKKTVPRPGNLLSPSGTLTFTSTFTSTLTGNRATGVAWTLNTCVLPGIPGRILPKFPKSPKISFGCLDFFQSPHSRFLPDALKKMQQKQQVAKDLFKSLPSH